MVRERTTFSEAYPAVGESVPQARDAIARYAARVVGLDGERLDALKSAVSEAVTNAVIHAYRGSPGQVRLTAIVAASELWVLIVDDGCGYRTPARSPGLGMGLALMAAASDGFTIAQRAEGGTEVRLRFATADTAAADG